MASNQGDESGLHNEPEQDEQPASQTMTLQEILALANNENNTDPLIHVRGIGLVSLSQLLRFAAAPTTSTSAPRRSERLAGRSRDDAELHEEDDDEDDDWEDDDDDGDYYGWAPSQNLKQWWPPVTKPIEAGVQLLMSGEFGLVSPKARGMNGTPVQKNVARSIVDRRTRMRGLHQEEVAADLVPNSNGTAVASYRGTDIYSGQFSTDSSFYYTCCRDFRLHVYDTTVPPLHVPPGSRRRDASDNQDLEYGHDTTMKVMKTIRAHPGRWTITDSHLSPDNERMIYASITPTVYMTTVLDGATQQTPINFADPARRGRNSGPWAWQDDDGFGIWSCRFSADGNEVVAGGSGKIFVYDLLADRRTVKIDAHDDDVNSCCWADTASGNVLISASDDTFLKVWDRRSIGTSQRPSGVLVGHTEGITFVSAKGDGRYIVSNGKDQALRLWDLRKMRSSMEFEARDKRYYGINGYDYRHGHYPKPKRDAHPNDCSVMTYRGHAVLRTLIRCHFSPMESTGSRYIYSGSADGRIHIWSLDGRVVQVLDRSKTLPISFDPSDPDPVDRPPASRSVVVRDVSWHSHQPVLMSAGWQNSAGKSVVARHEWKGLSKLNRLEDWVESELAERAERQAWKVRGTRLPGTFTSDEESE